jgi:uncharacterized protein (DUF1697 family)
VATRLIALLRGINVGRSKRVPMAQLRELLAELGYLQVATYLQSGNAIFSCTAAAAKTAVPDIEQAIAARVGVECKVIVRTAGELAGAMAADPLREVATDPARHLVGFLAGEPAPAGAAALAALKVAPDRIALIGRHVYLWCPQGVIASPLAKLPWERELQVAVTLRNWNTVSKLAAMTADAAPTIG